MNVNLFKKLSIFFAILLTGCIQTNLITIVLKEYKNESVRSYEGKEDRKFYTFCDGKYLSVLTTDTVRSKRVIFGRLLGNVYGHRFEFDIQNLLNRYIFDVDNGSHYSYGLELSKNNQYSEIGSPYVDRWKDESYSSKDSTQYTFFFTKFPRMGIRAFYSLDSTNYASLKLEKSEVMPYLAEGKITISNISRAIYFKIEADSLMYPFSGLSENRIFFESDSLENY